MTARALRPALVVLATLLRVATLSAQDTTRARTDSSHARADTAHKQPPPPPFVAAMPVEVPSGPLPPGSRYVFNRDSMLWTGSLTLSDLLANIPGVYVARAGFFGLPEYISYAGRGAAGLEIYWDGVRMLPLGRDSIYLDPSRFPLTDLKRVDVEVLPSLLRIYLVSDRHDTPTPRSMIRVMQGKFKTQGYAGQFQAKLPSGLGVDLAFDYRDTQGADPTLAGIRKDNAVDVIGKLEWLPTPRTGALYEIRHATVDHDSLLGSVGQVLMAPVHGRRDDSQFRFFTSSEDDGMGLRASVGVVSSSWTEDTVSVVPDQSMSRAFVDVGYGAWPGSIDVHALVGDRWLTRELGARAGLTLLPGVTLSGDAMHREYDRQRSGWMLHGALSLARGPFSLTGETSLADVVEAPTLALDTAQRVGDRGARVGIDTRPLAAHVGFRQHDAFQPSPFPNVLTMGGMSLSPKGTDLVADARVTPWSFLTVDGWYVNPSDSAVDFQPRTHGRVEATFRSKFWRTFRSGAFELKLQWAVESWSRGTAGLDDQGNVILLPGTTFMEGYIAFQIVGFTAYFDSRNARRTHSPYLPGYAYPRNAYTFGVQWEFSN